MCRGEYFDLRGTNRRMGRLHSEELHNWTSSSASTSDIGQRPVPVQKFNFLTMDPFEHLVGLFGRGSVRRKASTYTGQHNTEKHGHTSMPRAGFVPAIPMFERPKTVLALDRAATGTGIICTSHPIFL